MDEIIRSKRRSVLMTVNNALNLGVEYTRNLSKLDTFKKENVRKELHNICEGIRAELEFLHSLEEIMTLKMVYQPLSQKMRQICSKLGVETECLARHNMECSISNQSTEGDFQHALIQPHEISVKWNDIIGNYEAKEQIARIVLYPSFYVSGMQNNPGTCLPRPQRSVLLHGPPGTGKTMLIKAAAKAANIPILSLTGADLLSKWLGESEKCVRKVFYELNRLEKCILFLDEVDAIFSRRSRYDNASTTQCESSRRVKTEFLVHLQHFLDTASLHTFFVGATNLLQDIDPAFLRRFEHKISVRMPNQYAREVFLHKKAPNMNDGDRSRVVTKLKGFSYADMQNIWRIASMHALSSILTPTGIASTIRQLNIEDLDAAVHEYTCQ